MCALRRIHVWNHVYAVCRIELPIPLHCNAVDCGCWLYHRLYCMCFFLSVYSIEWRWLYLSFFRRMERNEKYAMWIREGARAYMSVCVSVHVFTSYCMAVLGIVRIGSVRFTTNVIQPAHSFTNGFLRAMDFFFFLITCITCDTVFSYLILYFGFPSLYYFAFFLLCFEKGQQTILVFGEKLISM